MATIGSMNILIGAESAALMRNLEKTRQDFARTARSIEANNQQMSRAMAGATAAANTLNTALKAIVPLVTVGALTQLVRSSINLGDELAKTARAAGLTVIELQAYQRGAALAGASTEQFNTAIEQFTKRLGEAERGQGQLAKTLASSGIALRDAAGDFRSTNDLLGDFAERVKNASSEAEAMALATDAFGRNGTQLVGFLRQGREGLAGMNEALREGAHLTDVHTAAFERAQDVLSETSRIIQMEMAVGIANSIIEFEKLKATFGAIGDAAVFFVEQLGNAFSGRGFDFGPIQERFAALREEFEAITSGAQAVASPQGLAALEAPALAAAAAVDQTADAIARMLEQGQRENEQLSALKAAHEGYGASVEHVNRAIELDNALRAAKITRLEAEESGLLAVMVANQKLRAEIEAGIEAEKKRAEAVKKRAQAAKDARDAQLRAQEQQAAETERLLNQPFINFLESVQSSTASAFETIYSGGVKSFSDLFTEAKRLATRFAAELTTLAIFNPQAVSSMLASTANFGAAGASATGGPISLSQPITGTPAGQAIGGGDSFLPMLGAVGLGAAGGAAIGSGFGGHGAIGGSIGGSVGAGIGFAVGGPAGAMIGATIGSLAGGAIGGMFGKGSDKSKGTLSGGLGSISGSGKKLGEVQSFLQQFDQSVANLLNLRQREAVDDALRQFGSVSVNFKGAFNQGPQDFAAQQRGRAVATGLGFNAQGIAGTGNAQQILQNIQTALETQRAIEDLTGAVTAFERQTEELEIQFETLTANAKRFGISLDGLSDAQTKAAADLRKSQDAAIASLLDPFKQLDAPLAAFAKELEIAGKSPAAQFAAVQAEFQRIAAEAQGGSIPAIQQLESAGRAFIQLAGAVGASPGQAAAVSQVQDVLATVRGEIATSQADAGIGVEDAIQRASRAEIDTLKELRDDVVEALRRIERNTR